MVITMLLFSLLLAFNIWMFLIWPKRALSHKLAVVLQIVAVYTFGLGVLTQIGVLPALESLAHDLTSPELDRFLSGNATIAAIGFQGLAVALEPTKTAFGATVALESLFLLLLTPVAFIGFVAYAIFIMPWAYIAYVFISIPVDAILTSGVDHCLELSAPNAEVSSYCFKQAVQDNTVGFKNFLIALPAVAIAFVIKFSHNIGGMLMEQLNITQLGSHHRNLLCRFAKHALWGVQGAVTLLLVVTLLMGTTGLAVIDANVGEVYGAILAVVLMVWLEILLFRQVRGWRITVTESLDNIGAGEKLSD